MSVRRAARLAALLAAVTAILGSATPALAVLSDPGGGTPALLSPDDAYALATAPVPLADQSGSSTSQVDSATALAASSLPGADTWVESDLSPEAAVGISGSLGMRPICWANAAWHRWGTWPYQQRLTDTTYWCAVYGSHITYRSSSTTATGTFCATGWTSTQLIAGGVGPGFTYFTTRSSAGWSCATVIPWVTIHTAHHQDVRRGDTGNTTVVGTG
jgi:hypothetical protein